MLHIKHIINNWLKYVNWSKNPPLPNLTKTVESQMLQGNGPCHFVKCTLRWLFHPVEKHFVAGIYLMLSFLRNVLSQCLTVHYTRMWLRVACLHLNKMYFSSWNLLIFLSYTACLIFNMYCSLNLQDKFWAVLLHFIFTFKLSLNHIIFSLKLMQTSLKLTHVPSPLW